MARALCDFLVTCRIYCCALWGSPEICHARAIGLSVKSREDEREKTGEALVKWPGFPFFSDRLRNGERGQIRSSIREDFNRQRLALSVALISASLLGLRRGDGSAQSSDGL